VNTQITGQNFHIDGSTITIFGLQGFPMGNDWGMGIDLMGNGKYINAQVSPAPVLDRILNIIDQDAAEGNLDQIAMVAVSNRVAIRLFLENVLQHRHFKKAKEGEEAGVSFLYLPECNLGKYTFPLGIIPEGVVGVGMIATLDSRYRVVGDEEHEPFALPAPSNLIEVESTVA
jgi:hypothetical protein